MRTVLTRAAGALVVGALAASLGACGDDDASGGGSGRPAVVVTANIVGDIVEHLVGADASVTVLMPPNSDPHGFAASARQAVEMREAEVLVTNGLGFEAGLQDAVDAAEHDGVPVLSLAELAPDHLELDGQADPHVFTDPARVAVATEALAGQLAARVPALDTPAFRARAASYVAELRALDAEVERTLAAVPAEHRKLVTNHEVFGYFAERYGFELLGSVIPASDTLAEPSAAQLADLAAAIHAAGVPAIFADASSPSRLAESLASEGTPVEVVELYSESLGDAGSGAATYVEMLRTDAHRIADALG